MKTSLSVAPAFLAVAATSLALSTAKLAADSVLPGYDLWITLDAQLGGIPLMGVPLGTWDFGAGPVATGPTDTIVQRLGTATDPSSTIPIEMIALQLKTVAPVDLGAGLGIYYVTPQSLRGGPASIGQMTVSFGTPAPGDETYSSTLDVYYDVRFGDIAGPILASDLLQLVLDPTKWEHEPPSGAWLIDGINHNLNGIDGANDFFPHLSVHDASGAAHHTVHMPEASPLSVIGVCGLGALAWSCIRRRTRP